MYQHDLAKKNMRFFNVLLVDAHASFCAFQHYTNDFVGVFERIVERVTQNRRGIGPAYVAAYIFDTLEKKLYTLAVTPTGQLLPTPITTVEVQDAAPSKT